MYPGGPTIRARGVAWIMQFGWWVDDKPTHLEMITVDTASIQLFAASDRRQQKILLCCESVGTKRRKEQD